MIYYRPSIKKPGGWRVEVKKESFLVASSRLSIAKWTTATTNKTNKKQHQIKTNKAFFLSNKKIHFGWTKQKPLIYYVSNDEPVVPLLGWRGVFQPSVLIIIRHFALDYIITLFFWKGMLTRTTGCHLLVLQGSLIYGRRLAPICKSWLGKNKTKKEQDPSVDILYGRAVNLFGRGVVFSALLCRPVTTFFFNIFSLRPLQFSPKSTGIVKFFWGKKPSKVSWLQ